MWSKGVVHIVLLVPMPFSHSFLVILQIHIQQRLAVEYPLRIHDILNLIMFLATPEFLQLLLQGLSMGNRRLFLKLFPLINLLEEHGAFCALDVPKLGR